MESREGFCPNGRGRSFHVARGTEDRKGAGTNSGESGTRSLEGASVRSRAENTEVCVKLKTFWPYFGVQKSEGLIGGIRSDPSVDRLTDLLTDPLTDSLTHVGSIEKSHCFTCYGKNKKLIRLFTCYRWQKRFAHPPTSSLTHQLSYSVTHSLTHSDIKLFCFTHEHVFKSEKD